MNKKISVVIPVYKVEKYLRQCVDSVIEQTYRNLEIILIDNASPDKCGEICDEYAAADDRVKVIHIAENRGVSPARNAGIDAATGDWLMFADSDDWFELDFVEKMLASMPVAEIDILIAGGYLAEYPNRQDICYAFNAPMIDTDGSMRQFFLAKTLALNFGMEHSKNAATIGPVWNKLFRTSFLRDNGIYLNTELQPQEDVLFCLNAIEKANGIASCEYIGYHYRKLENSALRSFHQKYPYMGKIFLTAAQKIVNDQPESNELTLALNKRVMFLIRQMLQCYFINPSNEKNHREIAKELKAFKIIPVVADALRCNSNKYLLKKEIALKYLMRYSGLLTLKLFTSFVKKLKGNL